MTFCQMTAVVVRLDEALGVICVDMEGIEVGTNALDWCKVLQWHEFFWLIIVHSCICNFMWECLGQLCYALLPPCCMMVVFTWVNAAPVSRILLLVVRSSPAMSCLVVESSIMFESRSEPASVEATGGNLKAINLMHLC